MTDVSVQPLLRDLRILELGHYIAAPFATRLLADLGADVIKVEPPNGGDPVRKWGHQEGDGSLWWSVHGRNKRSITLDMWADGAKDIILDLACHCDVVIENYKPGQLEKWGLTISAFEAARPGLTLVRISGYGQTGPEARRAGFGVIGEAKGGLRYLSGYPSSVTDLPPVRAGVSLGDSISGLYGALGALAAVIDQRASGRKEIRVIDVALGESVLSMMEGMLPEYGYLGTNREPVGSRILTAAPSNAYRTKDGGWILIAANSDRLWQTLSRLMGQPELASDPRFVDNPARLKNVEELDALISVWCGSLASEEVAAQLDDANIPASKIYRAADVVADQQYQARKMVTSITDPTFGPLLHPGVVPVVEGLERDEQIRWAGPTVGQHNREVYGGLLGKSEAEIAELEERGAI
jgi:crotonobetainyl-CoA:carnitine CoA-transferase CaiB-like acyl-CoA transferase